MANFNNHTIQFIYYTTIPNVIKVYQMWYLTNQIDTNTNVKSPLGNILYLDKINSHL